MNPILRNAISDAAPNAKKSKASDNRSFFHARTNPAAAEYNSRLYSAIPARWYSTGFPLSAVSRQAAIDPLSVGIRIIDVAQIEP